jgi:hypothetical protein
MCVNGEMRPVETISGMGGGKIKESGGDGEFKLSYIYYIVRTFVDAAMYLPLRTTIKK